jgi:hypothetical protein
MICLPLSLLVSLLLPCLSPPCLPLLPIPATVSYNQASIEPRNPLRDNMAPPISPSSISFGSTFAPFPTTCHGKSCARTTRRLSQVMARRRNYRFDWPSSLVSLVRVAIPTSSVREWLVLAAMPDHSRSTDHHIHAAACMAEAIPSQEERTCTHYRTP